MSALDTTPETKGLGYCLLELSKAKACKSLENIKIANWLLSLQKKQPDRLIRSLEPKAQSTGKIFSFRARKRRRKSGSLNRHTKRSKSTAIGCNCRNSGCLKLYVLKTFFLSPVLIFNAFVRFVGYYYFFFAFSFLFFCLFLFVFCFCFCFLWGFCFFFGFCFF